MIDKKETSSKEDWSDLEFYNGNKKSKPIEDISIPDLERFDGKYKKKMRDSFEFKSSTHFYNVSIL